MAEIKDKKKADNFLLTISAGLLVLLVGLSLLIPSPIFSKKHTDVTVGDTVIKVEISDSEEERVKGLADRKSLPRDSGMIFIFDEAKKYSFWMKGMTFPIDIIWIDDGKVVDITQHAQPEAGGTQSLTIYKPDKPAKYVLEVNANYIKENGIKIGDITESPIFK